MTVNSSLNAYSDCTIEGHSSVSEPPETPAPVFAVRAFKTALFGTPHLDYSKEGKPEPLVQSKRAERDEISAEEMFPAIVKRTSQTPKSHNTAMPKQDLFASPTKGILLTPGTGATRRKTVSFGALAIDGCGISDLAKSEEVLGTTASNTSDLWDLRDCNSDRHGQTKLTETLFKARNEMAAKQQPVEIADCRAPTLQDRLSHVRLTDGVHGNGSETVVEETIDVNKPCSRSGQHWKAEYEKYQEKSNQEMKKIIRYSQVAKSYAAKKDTEAMDLGEKLRKQLVEVAAMESKVAELAAQLATGSSQGRDESFHTGKLVNELAEQTALAMRYKQKAERNKAAILAKGSAIMAMDSPERDSDGLENQADPPGSAIDRGELSHQLKQMTFLRRELARFQCTVTAAEDKAAKLEEENLALKKKLARVKDEMGSYEIRRCAREEKHKQREKKLEAQKLEYKKRLAQMQVQLEYGKVLRSGEQRVRAEQKGPGETNDSLPKSSIPPDTHGSKEAEGRDGTAHNGEASKIVTESPRTLNGAPKASQDIENTEAELTAKYGVDIWVVEDEADIGINDSAKATASSQRRAKHQGTGLEKHRANIALKEINHNVIGGPALPKPASPLDRPDMTLEKNHELMVPSPPPILPSPEATISPATKKTYERRATVSSTRPSMVNIACSPAKQFPPRGLRQNAVTLSHPTAAAIDLALCRSSARLSSSRASSLRSTLPPDRAAAAKARLERRNADKRRLKEKGKENARP